MKIKTEVGFSTQDTGEVFYFEVDFTKELINLIEKAVQCMNKHSFESIKIGWYGFELLDEESQPTEDFRPDGGISIIVFKTNVYIYAQSKYDSGYQIESLPIEIINLTSNK